MSRFVSGWLKYLVPALALVAAFLVGYLVRGAGPMTETAGADDPETTTAEAPSLWTCAMHPQIILPSNDQLCPICNMELIPLEGGDGPGSGSGELVLSAEAAALADVATEPVLRRFVSRRLRLVGTVQADEARTGTITARVAGRLDKLYVDTTGQEVAKGEALAEIYSPELYAAQTELRAAARARSGAPESGVLAGSAQANFEAASERLRLWGMSQAQIDAVVAGGEIDEHVTVTAPASGVVLGREVSEGSYVATGAVLYKIADLSRVWATLEAFESEVASLREGQAVSFTARALPGRKFAGSVLFVDPVLDARTRTAEVRVEVDNADGLLKPGMLLEGRIDVALDARGEPVGDVSQAEPPLVVPSTAPLLTGERAVVYVRRPGGGNPTFVGRIVTLGPRAQDYFVVLDGLEAGELVVTRGGFKIDSALQIMAAPSMMNPVEDDPAAPVAQASADRTPCMGAELGKVLSVYYELQAHLAGDDETASSAAAGRLAATVGAVDCDVAEVASSTAGRWRRTTASLGDAADRVAAAADLGSRRAAFEPLSDLLWDALTSFGTGTDAAVRRFHCPMAFDNRGAFWIQPGETTANPYYGDMMLRCGSQKDVLSESSSEKS